MSFAKTAGITAGFLGAFGLGVAVGPAFVERDATAPVATAVPAPAPVSVTPDPAPAAKPARAKRAPRVETRAAAEPPAPAAEASRNADARAAVTPAVDHPELHKRLKPVLNRGANMNKAADGFRSAEQFATVAHAARNTEVPFLLLKHRVLEEKMSLDAAIRASKPNVDASSEAKKARAAAKADLDALRL